MPLFEEKKKRAGEAKMSKKEKKIEKQIHTHTL